MRQANRLITNVLVTYLRMALTIGIGLATTRLLLSTLGEVDFGLFMVLGGGLSLVMVVSTALADAAQRHLAYEIGRGDEAALREVFSTSAVIYLVLGLVIAGLGLVLRPAFLQGLTIPTGREAAAAWVYDLTLLNLSLSVLATPFLAVFIARQAMVQDAVFALLTSLAGLGAILLTPYVHADHLIGYAVLITATRLGFVGLQILRGLLLFPESRFSLRHVRRARTRDLVGFAGWSFLGTLAWQLRLQGGQILLNVFFGPSVNAAYAVANQVAVYLQNFSGAILQAARPVMTSLRGGGQHRALQQMVLSTSKLTVILLSCLAVPLLLETPTVLGLWLERVPEYAVGFVSLTIVWMLIYQLTAGHASGIIADGRIGAFTRYGSLVTVAPLPIGAGVFWLTSASPLWYVGIVVLSTAVFTLFRAWYVGRLLEIPMPRWAARVVVPSALVLVPGVLTGFLLRWGLPAGVGRLLLLVAVFSLLTLVLAWRVSLDGSERARLSGFGAAIRGRLGLASGGS